MNDANPPHDKRAIGLPGSGLVRRLLSQAEELAPPVLLFVIFITLWQVGAFHAAFNLKSYQLTFPDRIWASLVENASDLFNYAVITFVREAVVGYIIGSVAGLAAGILFAHSAFLRKGIYPMVVTLNAMPITAFAPLMILYFGFGPESKVAIVTVMTFAPMAVQSFKGLSSLDPLSHDLMRSYGASGWDVFRYFRIHNSLPYLFTALRLSTALCMIGAIIGEFFGAYGGLGFLMATSIHVFKMSIAWATIVVAAVLGVLFYTLIGVVERLVIPWHLSLRSR
jgi:NitT/TauT family transport system permease protein